MKKIDRMMLKARERKNAIVEPHVVEYVEYCMYLFDCEYNGVEPDREPPDGYEEWAHTPIELHEPTELDDNSYREMYDFFKEIEKEMETDI